MPSVWLTTFTAKDGSKRHRVMFRLGGRESVPKYAGSFKTKREANARKAWVAGELAAQRVPELRMTEPVSAPTLAQAAEVWQASRVDIAENTRIQHRSAIRRALPHLGSRRVDAIASQDVAALVSTLHEGGSSRETIRKTVAALAMIFDHAGITPNPARDRVQIRLPREERVELEPPTAEHVEAVYRTLQPAYRLPFLWLDWSGARVSTVETTRLGDYDEPQQRIRIRAAASKTRRALWVELPDVLAEAVEDSMPPREDRNPDAPLFPGAGVDALRTAIARACRANAIPAFSPHDLRHRRISLLHRQGRSWAEIGAFVGQRSLSVTADTYTHVLSGGCEVDLAGLLDQPSAVSSLTGVRRR